MPLRQTIGISLALLVISAGATAKAPEKSPSHHHGQQDAAKTDKGTAKSRTAGREGSRGLAHLRVVAQHARSARHHRLAVAEPAAEPDTYVGPQDPSAVGEFGKAVWYRRIGARTASGEPLDAIAATAAHRSLPLNSLAKVTNLDNGRTVIVRINDRGPVSHRLVIDLSPRAADELDMKRSGTAAVMVEPVESGTAPGDRPVAAVAAYHGTATQ